MKSCGSRGFCSAAGGLAFEQRDTIGVVQQLQYALGDQVLVDAALLPAKVV